MRAFIVPAGTPILAIKKNAEWRGENFIKSKTTKENLFFLEDLRVDPTGILTSACAPGGVTIGSAFASQGSYGFLRESDNYYCLVHRSYVQVH